jgi:hypothetical protein
MDLQEYQLRALETHIHRVQSELLNDDVQFWRAAQDSVTSADRRLVFTVAAPP